MSSGEDKEREEAIAMLRKIAPEKVDHIGEENLDRFMEYFSSFEEIRGTYGVVDIFGPRYGVFLVLSLTLVVLLSWLFRFPGFLSGMLLSVAFGYLWVAFRANYTQGAIHLGGRKGYIASQEFTYKHRDAGSQQHKVTRERGMYSLRYFVRSKDSSRFSWRPFALIFLIILSLIYAPILGISISLLVIAVVVNAGLKLWTPIALFLGPSTLESIKLFWKIRFCTGIPWASLLRDPVEPPQELDNTVDDILDMMPNYIHSNPWSLRLESNPDWLSIVSDFMIASTVIVLQAADVPAVRKELELLADSDYPERIIVIADESDLVDLVPSQLKPAIATEEEAIQLLTLIARKPSEFRNRMQQRATLFTNEGPFSSE